MMGADQFDGFVTPVDGGFQAEARGTVVGVFPIREDAIEAAFKRAAGRDVWFVDERGCTTSLAMA